MLGSQLGKPKPNMGGEICCGLVVERLPAKRMDQVRYLAGKPNVDVPTGTLNWLPADVAFHAIRFNLPRVKRTNGFMSLRSEKEINASHCQIAWFLFYALCFNSVAH